MLKIIGLIKILDVDAFEIYRSRVGATVNSYGGNVEFRGEKTRQVNTSIFLPIQSKDGGSGWNQTTDTRIFSP